MENVQTLHPTQIADTSKAVAFLETLDPDGWHNLVAIDPDLPTGHVGKVKGRTFGPGEKTSMGLWIEAFQGKANIYFSVNEPFEDAPDKKLKKQHIKTIRAIAIDKDLDPGDFTAQRQELSRFARTLIDDPLMPPSVVIDSGNGLQFFWVLGSKIPAHDEAKDWAEAQGHAFSVRFSSDHTWDVNRVMRLPWTVNLPDATKRAKGRKRTVSSVTYTSGERYGWASLSSWIKPVKPAQRPEVNDWPMLDMETIRAAAEFSDLSEALKKKFIADLATNADLSRLWEGSEAALSGDDKSGSAFLFTLAHCLKKLGYEADEFGALAWVWEPSNLHNKPDPMRQIARAWQRATVVRGVDEFEPVEISSPIASVKKKHESMWARSASKTALKSSNKPLIKGLLDLSAMSVLYGAPGSGKSFVALDLARCVSQGLPWQGHTTTRGLVVYVVAEGGIGFRRRIKALYDRGLMTDDNDLLLIPSSVDFLNPPGGMQPLIEVIREAEQEINKPCSFIIVDTLARAMAGGDENSPSDMGKLIKNADRIKELFGAHVMFVHHSGKDASRGARGHTSLLGAVDTEISVKDKTMYVTKQKEHECIPANEYAKFKLEQVVIGLDEDGDAVTSCVTNFILKGTEEFEALELTAIEQKMFDAIAEAIEVEREAPENPLVGGVYPKVTSKQVNACLSGEIAWRQALRIRATLVEKGAVKRQGNFYYIEAE